MTACARATVCAVVAFSLGVLCVSNSAAATGFAIRSPNTTLSGATTSDSVQINVTGPSTPLILRSILMMNGKNVTSALQPDTTCCYVDVKSLTDECS